MKYKFWVLSLGFLIFGQIFSADHNETKRLLIMINGRGYEVQNVTRHDKLRNIIDRFHVEWKYNTITSKILNFRNGEHYELNLDQTIEDLGLWSDDKMDDMYVYFFIENKELIVRTLTGKQVKISVNYFESIGTVKEKVLAQMTPENGFPVKPDFDKITFNHNGKNIPPDICLYSIDNLWDYPLTMIIRP